MLPPRTYTIEEYTRTVCPCCIAEGRDRAGADEPFIDGMLVSHGGKVWMRRFCGRHGESESLYEEDLEIWRARSGWNTPTLAVTPDRPDNFRGFPTGYRDGLPASHGQHTCVLVLNITERCNYACPTCYATARSPGTEAAQPEHPTLPEILHSVDTVLAREGGKLGVLMLSGGEPTVRDDLPELLPRLLERNITRIMINTNGRRVARDDRFVVLLQGVRDRVEVYLQLDAVQPGPHGRLRGEEVLSEKMTALQRLDEAGLFTTLVMTVARGVNDQHVGDVLLHGLSLPRCSGLAIQPMFGSGRVPAFDPQDRVTATGVLRRLETQTRGAVTWQDFIPLPCSHQDCCDITYLIRTTARDRGRATDWRSLPRLIGRDELRRWLGLVSNTITFDSLSQPLAELIRSGALQRVFSEQLRVGALDLARDLLRLCGCAPELGDLVASFRHGEEAAAQTSSAERTFRVTAKMFMDAHTFHEARIRQCCVHTGTFEPDPRRYSFCWRWLFSDAPDFPHSPLVSPLVSLT
jgi:uncharacterized radical SAM superfamily Fe-S cluster-containing enzyme